MKDLKDIFFYSIHYPSTEPHDCWWETDIDCISRERNKVEAAWREEELSEQNNRIDKFESETKITGYKVWIIYSYDADAPDWAEIKFLGNTREECLEWWNENWTDYYDPEDGEEAPKFNGRCGDKSYGFLMKEMEILLI